MKATSFISFPGITIVLLFAARLASAESWTNRFDPLVNGFCEAAAMTLDQSGDVFVTGSATGFSNNADYATVAYSSLGAALWTNWFNGPGNERDGATAIAVGSNDSLYVTGFATDTNGLTDCTTIAYSMTGTPLWTNNYCGGDDGDCGVGIAVGRNGNVFVMDVNENLVTLCYSSAGTPLWTNIYPNAGQSVSDSRAISVDTNNNVYITGTVDLSWYSSEYVTIAYSPLGSPLWTNLFVGPGGSVSIALDNSGHAYVTGSGGGEDYATVAYLLNGNALWTNWYADTEDGQAEAVAIAANDCGSIYVTGNATTNASYYPDYVTVAYSNSGMPLWTNQYQGPGGGYNTPSAITTGGGGTVYVTGYSAGAIEAFGYATIAYTSNGFPLWTNRYDPSFYGNNQPAAIAVDSAGSVYVTGTSLNTNGNFGYATVKYVAPLSVVAGGQNFGVVNGSFGFDVYGPAGSSVIVAGSANLQAWTPLLTNTLTSGFFHFSEPLQTNSAGRFYRVSSP